MTTKERTDEMGRLYSIREVVESIISRMEKKLETISPKTEKEEIDGYLPRLDYHKNQLKSIDNRITELRNNFFTFSVEEMYSMYGRYDKFISIDFHKNSKSAIQFGNSIMGVLIFNRREREDISKVLEAEEIHRTNGLIKINPSELCELDDNQVHEITNNGFMSGDIFEINSTAIDNYDRYKSKGGKKFLVL